MNARPILLCFALACMSLTGCSKEPSSPAAASPTEAKAATPVMPDAQVKQVAAISDSPSGNQLPNIDGNHVMQYVKEIVAIGSRPVGSPGHAKVEQYITIKLKGDQVEQDSFSAKTPVAESRSRTHCEIPGQERRHHRCSGSLRHNYPCPKPMWVPTMVDRRRPPVGACGPASRQAHDGYSIWLVWTDGEEAFAKWSEKTASTGPAAGAKVAAGRNRKKIKAFILVDMIGDADLDIQKETSPRHGSAILCTRRPATWDISHTSTREG